MKSFLIPVVAVALMAASCGESSEEAEEKKEDKAKPDVSACDCKTMVDEMQAQLDAGASHEEINEENMPMMEACNDLKNEMGREAFNEAMNACE